MRARVAGWRLQTGPGRIGAVMLGVLVLIAVFAPLIAPYDPALQVARPFLRPDAAHWLGTNDVGQDIFSELLYGARVSLIVGFVGATLATLIGATVGLAAGGYRGFVEQALMRMVDVVLSLPFLPLTLVLSVFVGPGLLTQIAVIGGVTWARMAREIRAQALPLRDRGYIQSARSMGAPSAYITTRHLLPAVLPLIVPQFVRSVNLAIQLETSLSFLGLGDPTQKSWGSILFYANARSAFLTDAWLWWIVPPGIGITLTVLAFAFIGFDLEQRARPQLRLGSLLRARVLGSPSEVEDAPRGSEGRRDGAVVPSPLTTGQASASLLSLRDLTVRYPGASRPAVDAVSFSLSAGEIVGVVGESGSGKSSLAMACLGLLRAPAEVAGSVLVRDRDLNRVSAREAATLRGDRIALIPQSAMNALNPVLTIEAQIIEAIRLHRDVSRAAARERAHAALGLVDIPASRARAYPHEFSGGMRQRALIAMAIATEPDVLVADEPTTGLDVLVQLEIIEVLRGLRARLGVGILFISHDLPAVFHIADRVLFMHKGRVVDEARDLDGFTDVTHPYARSLIAAARASQLPAGAQS
jgi:peptide/nickel transport system permease protein